jgi:hypothetical protein
MARFIHLTDERLLSRIKRSGIRMSSRGTALLCVHATPLLRNFQVTHQWLRELKRSGVRTIAAIHFKVGDGEMVLVGHYNEEPVAVTAAQAAKIFEQHSTGLGLQVLIQHKIKSAEIQRSYIPSQVVGWRYEPGSHGKPPYCGCSYCQRGLVRNRRIREKFVANQLHGIV